MIRREGEAVAVARLLRLEGLRSYPLGEPHAHEVTVDVVTPAANGDVGPETSPPRSSVIGRLPVSMSWRFR